MVVVAVGDDDGLHLVHRDLEVAVLFVGFLALALEGAAVHHEGPAVYLENVLGAGHFLRRSQRIQCDRHNSMINVNGQIRKGKFFGLKLKQRGWTQRNELCTMGR